jgi:hypothetical protein
MNALFDLLTKSELALELDAAMLELDAHAAKIAAQAREIEALRGACEAAWDVLKETPNSDVLLKIHRAMNWKESETK